MIEYDIIEDRIASILLYEGSADKGWENELSNKINSIDYQIVKQHPIISKKVPLRLYRVSEKDLRNEAVQCACIKNHDKESFCFPAERGKGLMDKITNDVQKVSKANKMIKERTKDEKTDCYAIDLNDVAVACGLR